MHRLRDRSWRMPVGLCRLAVLAAAAAALLPAAASAATYGAGTETRILDTSTDGHGSQSSAPLDYTSVGQYGDTTRTTAAEAHARVVTGGMHLSAFTGSSVFGGSPAQIYSSSEARGFFSDQFVLAAAGVPAGTLALMSFNFIATGGLSVNSTATSLDGLGGGGGASWSAAFQLHDSTHGVQWEGRQSASGSGGSTIWDGNVPPGPTSFSLAVTFGDVISWNMRASIEARSGATALFAGLPGIDGSAFADFGHTFAWGGITSLTDTNGVAITGFTALSPDTAFDYAHAYGHAVPAPVPEPAAAWLLALGLPAIGLMQARRRRRADPLQA